MKKQKIILWTLSVTQILLLLLWLAMEYAGKEAAAAPMLLFLFAALANGYFSNIVYLGTYKIQDSDNSFALVRNTCHFLTPMVPFAGLSGLGGYKHYLIRNIPCPPDGFKIITDGRFLNCSAMNCIEITGAECRKIIKNPDCAKKYFLSEPKSNQEAFLADVDPFINTEFVKILYSSAMFSVLEFPNGLCGIFMYKKMLDKQIGFYIDRQVAEKIIAEPKSFLNKISGMSNEGADGTVLLNEKQFECFSKQKHSSKKLSLEQDYRKELTSDMIREKLQSDVVKHTGGTRILAFFFGLMVISGIIMVAATGMRYMLFPSAVFLAGLVWALQKNKREKAEKRKYFSYAHFSIEETVCEGKRYVPHTESSDSYYVSFGNGREFDNNNIYQSTNIGDIVYIVSCPVNNKITQFYLYNKTHWKLAQELEPFVTRRVGEN